jgi:hypothetical protein
VDFLYGDFLSTEDTMDQVSARFDGGADGAHHLTARTGTENEVTVPIYGKGYQLFRELMTAAIGNTPGAAVTITGTDLELHADVGTAHYITSPTGLSALVPRSTFGAFGWTNPENNRIYYTAAGANLSALSVAGSPTVGFEANGNEITGATGQLAAAVAGDWLTVSGSASNNFDVLVSEVGALSFTVSGTDIAFVDATNRITRGAGGFVGIAAGDWIEITGSGSNDGRGRVLSVVDPNTLEIDRPGNARPRRGGRRGVRHDRRHRLAHDRRRQRDAR